MGVKDLWQLLEPCGRQVRVETLRGRRLAIDASIWLHQFMNAMKDSEQRTLAHAHIIGFLRRICKLLFHGIKPVFVFDGGVPALKRREINRRRNRRRDGKMSIEETAKRLVQAQLQLSSSDKVFKSPKKKSNQEEEWETVEPNNFVLSTGKRQDQQVDDTTSYMDQDAIEKPYTPTSKSTKVQQALDGALREASTKINTQTRDEFELPETDQMTEEDHRLPSNREMVNMIEENRHMLDPEWMDSEQFNQLPVELQYDMLMQAKEKARSTQHDRLELVKSSKNAMEFSLNQIGGLIQRNNITQKLSEVTSGTIATTKNRSHGRGEGAAFVPRRIAGERDKEFIMAKNDDAGYSLSMVESKSVGERVVDSHGKIIAHIVDLEPSSSQNITEDDYVGDDEIENVIAQLERGQNPKKSTSKQVKETKDASKEKPLTSVLLKPSDFPQNRLGTLKPSPLAPPSINIPSKGTQKKMTDYIKPAVQKSTHIVILDTDDETEVEDDKKKYDEDTKKAIALSLLSKENNFNDDLTKAMELSKQTALKEKSAQSPVVASPLVPVQLEHVQPALVKFYSAECRKAPHAIRAYFETAANLQGFGEAEQVMADFILNLTRNEVHEHWKRSQRRFEKMPINSDADLLACMRWWVEFCRQLQDLKLRYPDPYEDAIDDDYQEYQPVQIPPPSISAPINRRTLWDSDEDELAGYPSSISAHPSSDNPPSNISSPIEPEKLLYSRASPVPSSPEDFTKHPLLIPRNPTTIAPPLPPRNPQSSPPVPESPSTEPMDIEEVVPDSEDEEFEEVAIQLNTTIVVDSEESVETDSDVEIIEDLQSSTTWFKSPFQTSPKSSPVQTVQTTQTTQNQNPKPVPQIKNRQNNHRGQDVSHSLTLERNKRERQTQEVTPEMRDDVQELLRYFGIPFVIAPEEAEAQCAELCRLGLTEGIITDDSDVFLFASPPIQDPYTRVRADQAGGVRVYRHFFVDTKNIESYHSWDLLRQMNLSRNNLIMLAYLLGSDYTDGIPKVGPVAAMEILSEFGRHQDPLSTSLGPLKEFQKWWERLSWGTQTESDLSNKVLVSLRKMLVKPGQSYPAGFPDPAIQKAYLHPKVDDSTQEFQWGEFDMEGLALFLQEKLGWTPDKTYSTLEKTVDAITQRQNSGAQTSIEAYMEAEPFIMGTSTSVENRIKQARVKAAVKRFLNPDDPVPGPVKPRKRRPASSSSDSDNGMTKGPRLETTMPGLANASGKPKKRKSKK